MQDPITPPGDRCLTAPLYLRLSLTDRCDLRCRYCRPALGADGDGPAERPDLSDAALVRLLEQIHAARPMGKLRLTGGEPLVRPGVVGLVRRLAAALPGVELCLTSNGTRLERLAAPLAQAGVAAVNISLDTLDPGRFRALTGGAVERTVRGAEAARDAGFRRLKLNAVLQRSVNAGELADLVRFADRIGAEMRFIELMPMGCAAAAFEAERLPAAEALDELTRSFDPVADLGRQGTAHRHLLRVAGQERPVGFISPVSEPFCSSCARLRLDARGWLRPCLRSERRLDLLAGGDGPGQAAHVARTLAGLDRAPRRQATRWPGQRMSSIGG